MTGFQTSLRQAIEAFVQQRGMSRTRFGEAALGDPSFVTVFGRGRSPRLDTADRLLAFMGSSPSGPASGARSMRFWRSPGPNPRNLAGK